MGIRRTETTVTFRHPFKMPSVDGLQPAGTYKIVTDDDAVAITPFAITTRIATHLHTPALSLKPAARNVFTISTAELLVAIEQDRHLEATSQVQDTEINP
jgi:hypothetical protein